jgi:predicted HAD superfamily Cof-like phosphohydrolase
MSDISITALWFKRAVPTPTDKNLQVQTGVHLEEVCEMLDAMLPDANSAAAFFKTKTALFNLAEGLKKGIYKVEIADRKEVLDAVCDQLVTATGIGHMLGMDVPEGLNRVNSSNFSKFGRDGQPIFNENGKIIKGPSYAPPNLEGLY